MKISKKRLQEIVLEEMKGLQEVSPRSPRSYGQGDPRMDDHFAAQQAAPVKHDKQSAVAGAKARRAQGSGAVAATAGMTPLEGSIESRLQALHTELVEKGEVNAATVVKQHIDRALSAAKGEQ
tara:strand:+ start:9270 stop:9638 length:369 start_codon:yes stop_codon:yes gene_type:complete